MASLITKPSAISLETALQNLAVALTGKPVKAMPASLEGIVQFVAENVTSGGGGGDVEELAGSVSEKLQTDDTFISAVAAKVAEKNAVPGGAPGLDGPSMASVEASDGPSAAAVSMPTSEPAAAPAAPKRKTSKTTK